MLKVKGEFIFKESSAVAPTLPYLNWMVIELILMDCYLIHPILLKLMMLVVAESPMVVELV